MKSIVTLDGLKEKAIAIEGPIGFFNVRLSKEMILDPTILGTLTNNTYHHCNNTVAFVSDNTFYVIPHTKQIITLLLECKFKTKVMFVPFANGDYPIAEEEHWRNLQKEARQELEAEFVKNCEAYSDKHGFKSIPADLLSKCLEIPMEGIPTSTYHYVCLPAAKNLYSVPKEIGTYSTFENFCLFVYRDGKTYVTPNVTVPLALKEAGYYRGNRGVPFVCGEIIQDYHYFKIWKELQE